MNRLKKAVYGEFNGTPWNQNRGGFSVENIGYDLNGNIESLRRFNKSSQLNLLDELDY